MALFGRLFRKRTRPQSQQDRLLALASARITLESVHRLRPTGNAGVCFRPQSSSAFDTLMSDLPGLLGIAQRGAGTRFRIVSDEYGTRWVVLRDQEFEDLLSAVQLTADTFRERGFGEQLLAAVFPFQSQPDFEGKRQTVVWIYHFRRATFYPFIPRPGQKRDNAQELAIAAKMEKELPIEKALEAWYPLWGIPFLEEQG
ncbi:MAG: PspA-associated protein PspAB [Dehalococcoidia bacterium]